MDINFCEGEEMIIILFLKIQNVKKINDEITAASLHAQCIIFYKTDIFLEVNKVEIIMMIH